MKVDGMDDLALFINKMEGNRHKENAAAMQAYMKGLFPFIGIKAPERKDLTKDFIKKLTMVDNFGRVTRTLWELPEREYQYTAVDFLV